MADSSRSPFWHHPATRLGRWAGALAVAFLFLYIINSAVFIPIFGRTTDARLGWISRTIMPFYGIFMMLCGLAAGVVGLTAIFRRHERSWLVWLTLLPLASVLFLLLGEFLVPH